MEQITIKNLTFAYNLHSAFSLGNVSLSVASGEIVLITGVSGCGKTTLLRHLKREYMPAGVRNAESEIWIGNKRIEDLNDREQAHFVGFVGQDVDAPQVTDKVWHELAFGLESLGYSQDRMQKKIAEMTAFFGLEGIYHEKLCNLSGGQKQLVNLASVMAMEPEVLVLDEPTSQLDPLAATEFFQMIKKINNELGTTVVMSEHRLEEVFSMCDRVCVMEQGHVFAVGTPQQIAHQLYEEKHTLYKALPTASKLFFALGGTGEQIPLSVNDGRKWLRGYVKGAKDESEDIKGMSRALAPEVKKKADRTISQTNYAILADEVWFRYEKNGKDVLKACSLKVQLGKITAILGGNGAGKSTLLNVLAGHYSAYLGKIQYNGSKTEKRAIGLDDVGMLPQNPQAMFAKKTVQEELESSMSDNQELDLQEVINFCNLQLVLTQHPFDLSGGQMQKLALAKLLLENKKVLLMDEPSKGMDYTFKCEMGSLLRKLVEKGKTVLLVSHDVEFCARYADVCGLFFDGNVVSLSDSHDFFLENSFYTTATARMCRGLLPNVVLMEDVIHGWENGTRRIPAPHDETNGTSEQTRGQRNENINKRNGHNDIKFAQSKREIGWASEKSMKESAKSSMWYRWLLSIITVCLIMPITIYVGDVVLLHRKYYFISLLLIIEAIVCFFIRFEKRKPQVRDIMLLSMMSAIVVAGRTLFYMVPSVKPMAALVIIAGIGLGAESGFLVGCMAMLVSNIFFGQGPWTPWQMFAMGILGFMAGVIFENSKENIKNKKFLVCLFGFFSVIAIYGVIMNSASVLMYQENVNLKMLLSAVAVGLPYDLIHGVATFGFLWIGLRPLLDKLQRVREKVQFMK
ncbi:MAG: ATP-binding cassette domain-containing protein [Lachnospiraceae bacterium]|nr:ATP-binding cassette domain-containing protein [Lachnospiraceae bacterium]